MRKSWLSYEPVLSAVCKSLKPMHILEWGPGHSTETMLRECRYAEILAIEHDESWFKAWKSVFPETVTLAHCPIVLKPGSSQGYVTYPLRWLKQKGLPLGYFDLCFVDGRCRCDCLTLASILLKPTGVAVLHDSERKNYQLAFSMFSKVRQYADHRTAVLSLSDESHFPQL